MLNGLKMMTMKNNSSEFIENKMQIQQENAETINRMSPHFFHIADIKGCQR